MNAEPSHKKWEAKNNHRNTVDNQKPNLKYKRWRGKRWNYCMAYNQGGNLIECHTCIHVSHAEYSNNMPISCAD